MGLTFYAGLPSAVVLATSIALHHSGAPKYITLPVLHSSLVGFTAAIAAHPRFNYTKLFRKNPSDGSFPWWSLAAFYPYLLTLKAYVHCRRLVTREPVFTEVEPGLFVGGWPAGESDVPPGVKGVVDCTCELPRNGCLRGDVGYLNVPIWDTRGPRAGEIEGAVRWAVKIRGEKADGRVLVHCAFGKFLSLPISILFSLNPKLFSDVLNALNLYGLDNLNVWSGRIGVSSS